MLFKVMKRAIERGNYTSKDDMKEKVAILFADDKNTKEQYDELMQMLEQE